MRTLLTVALLGCVLALVRALTEQHAQVFRDRDVQVIDAGNSYFILSDGVPDHDHGPFPNEDNPNEVREQMHNYTVPKVPTTADSPGCLPMGAIGIAINGVVLFNPYTAELYNAVEGEHREIFDDCDGHPQQHGVYHYHKIPGCLWNDSNPQRDQLLGVALDGYPIYGPVDETGRRLTTADLDFCHGRTSGSGEYRYHMTADFPYILGCFSGQVNYQALRPPQRNETADGGRDGPGDGGRDGPGDGGRDGPGDGGRDGPGDGGRDGPGDGGRDGPDDGGRDGSGDRDDSPGDRRPRPPGGQEGLCRYANETNPGLQVRQEQSTESPSAASSATTGTTLVLTAVYTLLQYTRL